MAHWESCLPRYKFRELRKYATTIKIVLGNCRATALVIVIPDGDILDALAHYIMMASLTAMDLKEGYLVTTLNFNPKLIHFQPASGRAGPLA